MVAIVVHQMVPIATKLIPQLFHNPPDIFFGEIRAANLYTLSKSKLFAKLVMIPRGYLEHTGERERMTSVGELSPEYFHSRVEHS